MKIWEVFNLDSPIFKHEPLERTLVKFAFGYEVQDNDIQMGVGQLKNYDIFLSDFDHPECQWLMIRANSFGMRKSTGKGFIQTIDFDFRTEEPWNSSDGSGPKTWLKPKVTYLITSNMNVAIKGGK